MSDASVAPKERVNIVYKPNTGDQSETVELPLKLLMVGDYTGQSDERAVEDRRPINIDKDNFNDVMQGMGLNLTIPVKNKIANDDSEINVELKLEKISDFKPDNIVQQVDELKKLYEMRKALVSLKSPLANVPEFRKNLQKVIENKGTLDKVCNELGIEKQEG
ncbi:type VI secretion system contractile sheath small subunit [Piscirickettsia litoralis]|uniref:Type VI secretion system-associated protein n=1 Tax=Piscirickettsia litoralis TaxID=1891921 RepID=A0ABX3A1K8_9GAMM|nr:type VI secretion system contractile sheath small subunit [Piscirickettsia litoralis]ODN42519.1 type VI secretion system-associated protein [Piscirickettsia litoralis]